MDAFFVTAASQVGISEGLGRGDRLSETTFVTNDWSFIAPHLPREFEQHVGLLELEFLKSARMLIYSKGEIPSTEQLHRFLTAQLRLATLFLNYLWVVKDNAANSETGFAFVSVPNGVMFASNVMALRHWTATGTNTEIIFSRDELRKAREALRMTEIRETGDHRGLANIAGAEERFERASYFVQAARGQSDLGLKVGYYCSALEALFATSPTELAHQLSERVATFIQVEPIKRLEVFSTCKRAYRLRSQAIHGAKIDARDASALSSALDGYLRSIFSDILGSDSVLAFFRRSPEDFERSLLRVVLGESRGFVVDGA